MLHRAVLFLGHDSGPMHLAAAVGTPCVVVFSASNRPGAWYPCGDHHKVFYPPNPAAARPIETIEPGEVIIAAADFLDRDNPTEQLGDVRP